MIWYEIFKFEMKYRFRRSDTYLFFLFLFLFSIIGVDFIFEGVELGMVKKNSPLVIAKTMGAITGIFMILASMIMGVPILRDFEYDIASLMFINPFKKRDYLLGRFLGSFSILIFIFSSIFFGTMIGELLPWRDPNELLDFNVWTYFKPFFLIVLPTLFFGAALFFVTGTLSRKLVVVYTQGIVFFVLFILTKAIENEYLQALLDPFSLTTLSLLTDDWSNSERSLQNIPFSGVLLQNKLLWLLFGLITLIVGYKRFSFDLIKNKKPNKSCKIPDNQRVEAVSCPIPMIQLQEGVLPKWKQLLHLSGFYFMEIYKQASFWAIVICGMVIILINSVNLGTVHGVDSFPATYFIVEELQETSIYFFVILLVFYSGELMWKERGAKLNLIYDATPISNFISIASKYISLLLVYLVLIVALIISGVLFQTFNSYYQYEFQVYFYGYFLEILPFLALYTFAAFFIQAIVNHKFVGIILTLIFFISNIALGLLGFDHGVYFFGGNALGTYSDMNAYGHFLKPYLFVKSYWFFFGLILLLVASLLVARGTETDFIKRCKSIQYQLSKPLLKLGSLFVLSFLFLGSYIFYNTNILNEYWTNEEETAFRVAYEKTLKPLEYLPQPKIVAVNLNLELYPKNRNYTVEGYYILKNIHEQPIQEIHLQKLIESQVKLKSVHFEGGASENKKYEAYDYTIYELNKALLTGDSIRMDFKQSLTTKGFEEGNANIRMVHNGIFLQNQDFPTLGYNRKYELREEKERVIYQLPNRLNKAKRDDPRALLQARSGSDADLIRFEITIGTASDQTAIAPGNLLDEWTANNRNYFHYKVDKPMINFYAMLSAKYEIKKDTWQPKTDTSTQTVDLEIYYHKGHEYNLDRMMKGMKTSLDYYSTHFSPYQYQQLRIMEFPRYAEFAQSFPGTVPFSEAIGFVLDIDDKKDVDMAFYVTAHEVAHQWWGMQIEAANVQGQNLVLETLAQYSALMVLKEHYSEEKVQQFLQAQLEDYEEGKRRANEEEPSLEFVENEDYIYYAKGVINMYALQKYIGEEQVNLALQRFIEDWNSVDGKLKMETKRYATSEDLLAYFRTVTPDSLQNVLYDLFQNVASLTILKE